MMNRREKKLPRHRGKGEERRAALVTTRGGSIACFMDRPSSRIVGIMFV